MTPHFLNLFTHPDLAWHEIRQEEQQHSSHYLRHLLLLALIPAVSLYLGTTQVGWSLADDERVRLDERSALLLAVNIYLTALAGCLIMGGFIRWMSRTFDSRPSFNQCIGFAAYTATPFFLAGLVALYPLRWLAVLALGLACAYSTFLLFIGLPTFMRTRKEDGLFYAISVWGVAVLAVVTLLVSAILHWHYYTHPVYERTASETGYPTREERPSVEEQQRGRE